MGQQCPLMRNSDPGDAGYQLLGKPFRDVVGPIKWSSLELDREERLKIAVDHAVWTVQYART
jgi:hypothetical protein